MDDYEKAELENEKMKVRQLAKESDNRCRQITRLRDIIVEMLAEKYLDG